MLKTFKTELIDNGTVVIPVSVRSQAPKTAVTGQLADGTIKIDLKAVPEQGKANAALLKFLAKEFDVTSGHASIIKGSSSRRKLVRIKCFQ